MRARLAALAVLVALVAIPATAALPAPQAQAQAQAQAHEGTGAADVARPVAPVLAYYYIWYNRNSWDRAKTDLPQLGGYSSDDIDVMRQHVRMAKSAGISGFVVSWKNTEALTRRLAQLVNVARSEEFKLSIIYEGLDFARNALPVATVQADLGEFARRFAPDPVFRIFDKPIVILSGTWKSSREDVLRVTGPLRDSVRVLASERNAAEYRRLADVVGGNAYYWSSVDTGRDQQHAEKLGELAAAVHETGGLWVAPFAPGFDARHIGGSRVVERRGGDELREQYRTAIRSSPDALGLISWNEFSENTHVEPSRGFGDTYLKALRDISGTAPPPAGPLGADSSASSDASLPWLDSAGWWALGGTLALLLGWVLFTIRSRADATAEPFLATATPHRGLVGALFGAANNSRTRTVSLVLVLAVAAVGSLSALARPEPSPARSAPNYVGVKPARDPDAVVIGTAGDVACAADPRGRGAQEKRQPNSCQDQATADLLTAIDPDAVLALGDIQYPNGSLQRIQEGYDKSWGRFKDRTYPVVGNHEYSTTAATGYFNYFGAAAGSAATGYYSYDIGAWHVIALNSECDHVGTCDQGSPQETWLRADLAAHPTRCTLVYWHQPRFSSGTHGNKFRYTAFWQALYDAGADLVLSGHDHDYERLGPLNAAGDIDPERGIPSFVVGTGGSTLYRFRHVVPGSEMRLQDVFGVLKLTLRPNDFDWEFVGVPGTAATDSGSSTCH